MNHTWIWRTLVSSFLVVAIAVAGWTLSAVANMPKEYTTKEELRELRKENRDDHKELKKLILDLYKEGA